MDFLLRILEVITVFDVRINLCIAFLLWAFTALLMGFVIEFVFFVGRKIAALKRPGKPLNEECVLFRNRSKEVKSRG